MYKREAAQITLPEEFLLPFEGKLNRENRWVRMAFLVPWWDYEELYASSFKTGRRGKQAYGVRMALGALLIQEQLGLSDRETISLICENPYMQYFLGCTHFITDRPLFSYSAMLRFRRRLGRTLVREVSEKLSLALAGQSSKKARKRSRSS